MPHEPPMVLHVRVVTGTGGGPEKTILNSPRFLTPHGYRVLCAYMYPAGDPGFDELGRKAKALDAPLEGIADRGPFDTRVVRRLLNICRRDRVAIWHAHDYKSNAIGLLLRRFWPMHLVTTVHGWVKFTRRTPLYYGLDRRFWLRRYDRVICVSPDLRQQCLAMKVPPERCLLIENAIDTEQYARRTPREEAKRQCGVAPDRVLVGAVGRLSEEKDFAGLIRVADRLIAEGFPLELVIAGEGDQRDALGRLIAELRREDRMHLLGYCADPVPLYEAMDVFVVNSLREGLPNVLLEAMALEVPTVATRVAGIPRVIEHGRNGFLHEPGDAVGLEHNLKRLLSDAALRVTLGAGARRTVEERFSFAVRMAKIRAIYADLLGAAAPRPTALAPGAEYASSIAAGSDGREGADPQEGNAVAGPGV